MNPEDFKQAWQTPSSQTRLTIDADLLLQEVRRNDRNFSDTIFWRDVREVGVGLVMIPIWLYMGVQMALPWTWYLTVPGLVWIVVFLLVDRRRHRQPPAGPNESLRERVESSLAQVEHQIWLLRNICWWYLAPLFVPMLAFFGQVGWTVRDGGWWTVLATFLMVGFASTVMAAVYRLNQHAVRSSLEPRRQELKTLLASLQDETPAAE